MSIQREGCFFQYYRLIMICEGIENRLQCLDNSMQNTVIRQVEKHRRMTWIPDPPEDYHISLWGLVSKDPRHTARKYISIPV